MASQPTKYDTFTPLSEKRKARAKHKQLMAQAQAQHAFNERHRAGKRTIAYGPASSVDLAREFARSEDLHLEAIFTNPARLPEMIELIEQREHIDQLVIVHADALPYAALVKLLIAARSSGVVVTALGNINFSRRMIFGVLS